MNWIQDCSISSTLECWPDKLQTCNCRSKWSVNACLSCSGKAVFWAQLNARRHKEEVLHQCVWSNSSILHLIPAADNDESCNNVLSCTISYHKHLKSAVLGRLAPVSAAGTVSHAWQAQEGHSCTGRSTGPWLPWYWNRFPNSHHLHNSLTALPAYNDGANSVHELQLPVLGKLRDWCQTVKGLIITTVLTVTIRYFAFPCQPRKKQAWYHSSLVLAKSDSSKKPNTHELKMHLVLCSIFLYSPSNMIYIWL